MVHLNTLQEKYGEKGMTVLAISKQDRSAVEKFIEEFKPTYPTVSEKSDSMRAYARSSYPSSFLINSDGRILWLGHPGELGDGTIDQALENTKILPAWPDALDPVKKAFLKDKYTEALEKAQKDIERGELAEEDAAAAKGIVEWIEWYGNSTLEGAAADATGGKVYEAGLAYQHVADLYKHHELGEKADAALKELLSDKDRKLEFKAGEKLAKILEEIRDLKPKKALQKLKPMLSKKYKETAAGKKAATVAEVLEKELEQG